MNDATSTREFTDAERTLILWMLDHGESEAQQFLPQFERARVTSQRCLCGCASIHFSVEGQSAPVGGFHLLADFVFGGEADLSGIFVYEQGGVLSGLEVYGLAGDAPRTLPTPDMLRSSPFATAST